MMSTVAGVADAAGRGVEPDSADRIDASTSTRDWFSAPAQNAGCECDVSARTEWVRLDLAGAVERGNVIGRGHSVNQPDGVLTTKCGERATGHACVENPGGHRPKGDIANDRPDEVGRDATVFTQTTVASGWRPA